MKKRFIELLVVWLATGMCYWAALDAEEPNEVVLPIVEPIEADDYPAPFVEVFEEESIEVQEEVVEEVHLYESPLEADIQEAVISLCGDDFDAAVVIAMIERESRCDSQSIGDGGKSKGLMQIQERWHSDRMEDLECDDLLDPIQNITVGIDYLKELSSMGKPIEWVLMAYNGGIDYANKKTKTSTYAVEILQRAEELKGEGYGHNIDL